MCLALPEFPNLPDDKPLAALAMVLTYVRQLWEFVESSKRALFAVALTFICVLGICLRVWTDTALPLLADAVPMLVAIAGVVMSYKQPKRESHFMATVVLFTVGLTGTGIMSWTRIRSERAHKYEVRDLTDRMDSVKNQNTQILFSLTPKQGGKTTQESEIERRQNLEKALRNEYILSHDNVSPGLIAGTEFPPSNWMNRRLRELGEKWAVAVPSQPLVSPQPQQPLRTEEGKVFINVAYGDDSAPDVLSYASDDPHMRCGPGFTCLAEDQTIAGSIQLDFTGKDYKRIFFAIAAISNTPIQRYMVIATLHTADGQIPHGISIYRSGLPRTTAPQTGVQWVQTEVQDLVPISKSKGYSDFGIDITATPDSDVDFIIGFRIVGPTLPVHAVQVPFHIIRPAVR